MPSGFDDVGVGFKQKYTLAGGIPMKHSNSSKGLIVSAFGVGLFLAYCFPSKFIIISLAVMLVVAGIFLVRA